MAFAFISSPVRGLDTVRAEVHSLKLPDGHTIYVDEIDHPRPRDEASLFTVKDLFDQIRLSPEFVVVLATPRHGSPLRIGSAEAHTSYWEAELFYALLLLKETHVFELNGFSPEPKLAAILDVLRAAVPGSRWKKFPHLSQLPGLIERLLVDRLRQRASRRSRRLATLHRFIEGVFRLRGRDGFGGTAEQECVQFFSGRWHDDTVKPNLDLVSKLLDDVSRLKNEQDRLARLWIAFRELSGASPERPASNEALPLWDKFLGEWASAGSWYGLHGHPSLAVLPALVNQAFVRGRMREVRSAEWNHRDLSYPGGALASSRYSIARRVRSPSVRRFLMRAALADVERSVKDATGNINHLRLIRGSIYRQQYAFGAAVREYEAVVRDYQRRGATDADMGIALSELGFGLLFRFRLLKGRALLEEGVRLLTTSNARSGFLVRAQRKLAMAYLITGRVTDARTTRNMSRTVAAENMALDQFR